VLRRYRSLLLQGRDAAASGRLLTRSALKSLAGEAADQLLMWELMPQPAEQGDLVQSDLDRLDEFIGELKTRCHASDQKCRRLAAIVADGTSTLVFTGARETVHYLRRQLTGAAWCTGNEAGIGISRMAREDVLSWFRPDPPREGGPGVLITTDVSAEGIDLQRAARVVHYDLPWTAVRLDQRDGRALRLGSRHASVEVIRFDMPREIERRLGQLGTLARKRRLPGKAGVDPAGVRPWSWRDRLAERFAGEAAAGPPGFCGLYGPEPGMLAGFAVISGDPGRRAIAPVAAVIGYRDARGTWTEDPHIVRQVMDRAERALPRPVHPGELKGAVAAVAGIIRGRLRTIQLAQWAHRLSPTQTRLVVRLNRMAARAVQARNRSLLSSVERAIGFVRRGHTAGEEMWLEHLTTLPDPALIGELRPCPVSLSGPPPAYSELLGLVIFAPSCSTSTER
jgi:hypothetical protein